MQEVGDNNPWKKEWCCPRKTYPPCQGQALLGAEKEEKSLRLVCGNVEGQTGETKKGSLPKDDCRYLPGCTGEGCNYVIALERLVQSQNDTIKAVLLRLARIVVDTPERCSPALVQLAIDQGMVL